jgi:hypothetical protein
MEDKENLGLETLLENQQHQLGLVFSEGDSVDGKALAILGANVAVIIFISQATSGLPTWQYFLLYGPFVLSLGLDIFSIWPRNYKGPGVEAISTYVNMEREKLLLKLLSNTQAAILHNSHLNRIRLRTCLYSIGLTGLGFIILLGIL